MTLTVTFEIPILTKFPQDKRPNAYHVRLLKKELSANAMGIATSLGGGHYGHTGLLLPAAEYAALPNSAPFVIPGRPDLPALGGGAGAAASINAQTTYRDQTHTYDLCHAVIRGLKAQLMEAVPRIYIEAVESPDYGFATVTLETILTHLRTTYGTITQDDLQENLEKLEAAWNPETTIEALFSRAQKLRAFAHDGGEAISDGAAVRALLKAFTKSGVMAEGIKDWHKKATADQTWANMPRHFLAANKERLRSITASQAGFSTSNSANAARNTTTTGNSTTPSTVPYCWTHGIGHNADHTSATCTTKAEGHVDTATWDNMQGGNNTIRRRRNERTIYRRPQRNNSNTANVATTEN